MAGGGGLGAHVADVFPDFSSTEDMLSYVEGVLAFAEDADGFAKAREAEGDAEAAPLPADGQVSAAERRGAPLLRRERPAGAPAVPQLGALQQDARRDRGAPTARARLAL